MTTAAWCRRCGRGAPIADSELVGDGGGDPDLLPVLVPPDGWIGDPDDPNSGVICGGCSTLEESAAWVDGLVLIESMEMEDDDA